MTKLPTKLHFSINLNGNLSKNILFSKQICHFWSRIPKYVVHGWHNISKFWSETQKNMQPLGNSMKIFLTCPVVTVNHNHLQICLCFVSLPILPEVVQHLSLAGLVSISGLVSMETRHWYQTKMYELLGNVYLKSQILEHPQNWWMLEHFWCISIAQKCDIYIL